MSENCTHQCETCGKSCGERTAESLRQEPHRLSQIQNVIAVVSGKGGVGKSLVTSLLAVSMRRKGYQCGILDADITGPSIPRAFGIHQKACASEDGILPVPSQRGIKVMSLNLLLEHDTDPVLWRGPVIASAVSQFWTDVIWGKTDYLFVDMPPGTGDVPLTVFQSLPVKGIIVVTSPQELVSMIVGKAVRMAEMMQIPVLGIVENLSYFQCPDCGGKHYLFGISQIEEIAREHQIQAVSRLPINPAVSALCDRGQIEEADPSFLSCLNEVLAAL